MLKQTQIGTYPVSIKVAHVVVLFQNLEAEDLGGYSPMVSSTSTANEMPTQLAVTQSDMQLHLMAPVHHLLQQN